MKKENKDIKEKPKKEKKSKESKALKKQGKVRSVCSKIGTALKKKWLINGTQTLILVVIIIIAYIGVNILLDNVVLPEIDLTSDKLYSISEETKDKVGSIEKEVTITLINYDENETMLNFVDKYKALNKNITIERVDDLTSRTDLTQKYSLSSTDSLIIVKCEELEKQLTSSDLYTFDYSTYEEIDLTEEAITNAIVNVTTGSKPKLYFMSNHIAYSSYYYSTILSSLQNEANEVESLDILSYGKVPDDCDTLIITTLKEDVTEKEKDEILKYIKKGGSLLLMCGPNYTNAELTNFQEILDQYGMNISDGVLFEQTTSNMLSGYPDIIIAEAQSTSITNNLNMSLNLCVIDAGRITFDEDKLEELGVTYETIATTSEKAFERTDLTQTSTSKTSGDKDAGSSIIAALVTKTYTQDTEDEDSTEVKSKLIVFSNELFAMDMSIDINGYNMTTLSLYNNKDMILNSISYLNERKNTITIRKDYNSVSYTVTEQQHNIIMGIIFITPLVIIIAGIIVWQVRRRKK